MAQLFELSGRAYENSSGVPYALAKAYFYVTGTTTPQDTYTTASLGVANTNPVVAGADGVFGDIYFAAKRYKIVIKDADGNTLRTWDPVDGTSQMITAASAPSPTYPFLRYYNTGDGHTYRRNAADNAWVDEGPVDSIGNAATVTETLTGTETAKLVTPDGAAALWQRGTNITPSAGTVSLPSTGGRVFNVAAGNFSSISTAQGGRTLLFIHGGTSVITHNGTSLICLGGANITTEAGDISEWTNEAAADASGSNWRMTNYCRDATTLAPIPDYAAIQSEMETPTSALRWITPAILKYHPLMPKAWVVFNGTGTPAITASSNVTSITDNGTGDFTINFTTALSSTAYAWFGTARAVTAGAGVTVTAESGDTKTASALQIKVRRSSTDAAFDSAEIAVFVFGDFA